MRVKARARKDDESVRTRLPEEGRIPSDRIGVVGVAPCSTISLSSMFRVPLVSPRFRLAYLHYIRLSRFFFCGAQRSAKRRGASGKQAHGAQALPQRQRSV